jgi:hypothetical protein
MIMARSKREASKESDSKADVKMTNDISIGELTKDLLIAKAEMMFQSCMVGMCFFRTRQESERRDGVRRQWDTVVTIRLAMSGSLPSMHSKNATQINFTGQLDVLASLMEIKTVVAISNARSGKRTNSMRHAN